MWDHSSAKRTVMKPSVILKIGPYVHSPRIIHSLRTKTYSELVRSIVTGERLNESNAISGIDHRFFKAPAETPFQNGCLVEFLNGVLQRKMSVKNSNDSLTKPLPEEHRRTEARNQPSEQRQ
ncbi:unnamed protein product [Soboliphyme baturini]|uniref:Doublecortin domain-containing protein n=1 Tax=Soboliphyme baturini TaxID=241478 RepID=A0A183IYU5_9BILA|nr:unnamed protein product [Soboliphyme baturini]